MKNEEYHTTDYNIYNNMQCPKLIGTANKVQFSRVVDTIANNFGSYVISYPFSGINRDYQKGDFEESGFYKGQDFSLGSNYFYQSGRTCDETSDIECQGKPAWIYLRDIPTGKIPLLNNISFTDATGCELPILSQRGIVPGILEDISDLSPLNIMENISKKGNVVDDQCKKVMYPEGTHIYDLQAKNKTWKMKTKCSPSYKHLKQTTDLTADFEIPGAIPLVNNDNPSISQQLETFESVELFESFESLYLFISRQLSLLSQQLQIYRWITILFFTFLLFLFLLMHFSF